MESQGNLKEVFELVEAEYYKKLNLLVINSEKRRNEHMKFLIGNIQCSRSGLVSCNLVMRWILPPILPKL